MWDPADRERLLEATRVAVAAMGPVPKYEVEIEAVDGPYARVRVRDVEGRLTPMFGFGVRKDGAWRMVAFGTDFEPAFYAEHGIPEPLKLG